MPNNRQADLQRPDLQELLGMTPSEIIKRSQMQCRPVRKQYALGSKNGWKKARSGFAAYYNEMRVYSMCTDGKRYSYIRFYGPPELSTPVWVWCSCPYFKYYLEVALANRNGTSIKTTSGPGQETYKGRTVSRKPVINKPPNVRNPSQAIYLCKHLALAAKLGLAQKKDMASEQYEDDEPREASFRSARIKPVHLPFQDF
jgi:hypothetical protein